MLVCFCFFTIIFSDIVVQKLSSFVFCCSDHSYWNLNVLEYFILSFLKWLMKIKQRSLSVAEASMCQDLLTLFYWACSVLMY
jgi:hypothetical protein